MALSSGYYEIEKYLLCLCYIDTMTELSFQWVYYVIRIFVLQRSERELIANGKNISVTQENKLQYIRYVCFGMFRYVLGYFFIEHFCYSINPGFLEFSQITLTVCFAGLGVDSRFEDLTVKVAQNCSCK